MAAFSAMRLIVSHGLKPAHFIIDEEEESKRSQTDDLVELLNFDALSLSQEVKKMRRNAGAGVSNRSP